MARLGLCALVLLTVAGCASVQALTIVDTFGPGYTYNEGGGWNVMGADSWGEYFSTAMGFVPAGTCVLDSVAAALSVYDETQPDNSVRLSLVEDESGHPGSTLLESWFIVDAMPPLMVDQAPVMADSVLHPTLQAGTLYWLVAEAGTSHQMLVWDESEVPDSGPAAQKYKSEPWRTYTTARCAFRVDGLDDVPIPEPSSFALASIGLAALLLLRRRA